MITTVAQLRDRSMAGVADVAYILPCSTQEKVVCKERKCAFRGDRLQLKMYAAGRKWN